MPEASPVAVEIKKLLQISPVTERYEYLYEQGVMLLYGEVNPEMMLNFFINSVAFAKRNGNRKPIWVVLYSPGGYFDDGFGIYDTIRALVNSGISVNTVGLGDVSSMAVCILQAGSRRYAMPNTQFVVHQGRSNDGPDMKEINEQKEAIRNFDRLNDRILTVIAQRIGMSLKDIKAHTRKKDRLLIGEEALTFGDNGLVDEIVSSFPFNNS